ncbi:MmpS family transport accessory protein [Nonomuraea sp. NPDC050202]|uniref:MmpS family transport accessory protein n=1 Tax=Nonomuraea sp. NPDC050202 TaxID=3155035 RepID=UPI003407FAD9
MTTTPRTLLAIAAVTALMSGCAPATTAPATPEPTPTPATVYPETVVYRAYGDAYLADLTMETPSGTRQVADVELPAEETWLMHSGEFVYVSAQSKGETGSITCEIAVDGKVISRNESDGAYVIASCQGTVP